MKKIVVAAGIALMIMIVALGLRRRHAKCS